MRRIRRDKIGENKENEPIYEEIEFTPLQFGVADDAHYRVEIKVGNLDEVRELHQRGRLIGLRMIGTPEGRVTQRNIVKPQDIEGLGLPLGEEE